MAVMAGDKGADDPKNAAKPQSPKITLPKFQELPKMDDLNQPKEDKSGLEAIHPAATAQYSVVRVVHAKGFRPSPSGATPVGGSLSSVSLLGQPLATEKFTTLVRVRSPERAPAPIQIHVLDPRGDSAMSSQGEVSFRGVKGDEVDYLVDWDPTPCRAAGDYTVNIRIAGRDMGTWPLKFVLEKK
jgi:hypothetical protein